MGLDDRDYMKQSDEEEVIQLKDIIFGVAKLVLVFIFFIFSLRFPILWIKIPLALAILFLGWRWIVRGWNKGLKNTTSATPSRPSQPRYLDTGSQEPNRDEEDVIKRLIAHDAAGEFGKAKTLIQSLDGRIFPEAEARELAVIARNYFPVILEETENGYRFGLGSSDN